MDATWDRHDSEHEDFASSRELQEQALEIHRRMFGEEHPDTLTAKDSLARMKPRTLRHWLQLLFG